jgi:branched-chain amino acid aminotransferase
LNGRDRHVTVAEMLKKVEKIWVDGRLVDWDAATEHVLAHTLHYGLGAFEGIRAYARADGQVGIFRLPEHIDRLFDSCHAATLDIPFSRAELGQACRAVIRENRLGSAYVRPLVYLGYGGIGLGSTESPVRAIVAAYDWGTYLGAEGLKRGIRAMVSTFRRASVDATLCKAKLCGNYVTSVLAKREAHRLGLDEAILLDGSGHAAEGSGENLFLVKRGVLLTPPLGSAVLAGITRDSALRMARDLGIETREALLTRDELWCADEIFLTGTSAEITPVIELDGRRIGTGEPGPVTRRVQELFFDTVSGPRPRYPDWLTAV